MIIIVFRDFQCLLIAASAEGKPNKLLSQKHCCLSREIRKSKKKTRIVIQGVFSLFSPRKVLSMELVPPTSEKMTFHPEKL